MRRLLTSGALLTALAAVGSAPSAPAQPAASARGVATVEMMVVGRTHTLLRARSVGLRASSVRIGRHRCSVPRDTPLAGLLAVGLSVRVSDAAGCDPSALFVTKVGPDRNHGFAGWECKVGPVSSSFGCGDPGQRLRSGAQLVWFWCLRATACQRTLALKPPSAAPIRGAPFTVTVVGYDDNGHGRPVTGASVRLGTQSATSGPGGLVSLIGPPAPGRYAVSASKPGLVAAFALPVTVR